MTQDVARQQEPAPGHDLAPSRSLRVAMLCVHTSPLDQPGTGDAGGMNVYVANLARALARQGAQVEIFTRATRSDQPETMTFPDAPGVLVRHVAAGPYEGLDKNDLPGQLCAFTAGVLRTEAASARGWYDVVHAHYWLSGQVGFLAAERWGVPLVHTMHTLARVKDASLAPGDTPEPHGRVIGEGQVVREADALIASTAEEADVLVRDYDADPAAVHVVAPGVDLEVYRPGDKAEARAALGLDPDRHYVLFAGRIQPLKGPDVLVRAFARLTDEARRRGVPEDRLARLVVLGGPSGRPTALRELAALVTTEGVDDLVDLRPPVASDELARWFRAVDVVAMPSRSESFGLVAAEAQACGTPVVATAVGGLRSVVLDGVTGRLVDGHDPAEWARVLGEVLDDDDARAVLAAGARSRFDRFGWDAAASEVLEVYARAARTAGSERASVAG